MIANVYRYGDRYIPITDDDRKAIENSSQRYVYVNVVDIVPGSSIAKRILRAQVRSHLASLGRQDLLQLYDKLGAAGHEVCSQWLYPRPGGCLGCPFGRQADYGPGDDEGGDAGGPEGSKWHQQVQDNSLGATYMPNVLSEEFGYGPPDAGCILTPIFIDAPGRGFGKGDPAGYDDDHRPPNPGKADNDDRVTDTHTGSVLTELPVDTRPKDKYPGDTVVNNGLGFWEPWGDETGVHTPKYPDHLVEYIDIRIDPTRPFPNYDDTAKEEVPEHYQVNSNVGGDDDKKPKRNVMTQDQVDLAVSKVPAQFDTHDRPSIVQDDTQTAIMGY
jgi:hypothetical protein